jgi:GWxTD domain-containing protein
MSRAIGAGLLVGLMTVLPVGAVVEPEYGELPACSDAPPLFCFDGTYYLDGDRHKAEIYLMVCNEGLQFVRYSDGYRATADVLVVLYDDEGEQVAGDSYRIRLSAREYRETTSVDSCKYTSIDFSTPPGEYRMEVTVIDGDTHSRRTVGARVKIPDLTQGPSLSDLTLLVRDPAITRGRWPGFSPYSRRVYDVTEDEIAYHYDVYNTGPGDSLRVTVEVLDEDDRVVYTETRIAGGAEAETGTAPRILPADSLPNGRNVLRIVLEDPEGKKVAETSEDFAVLSQTTLLSRDIEEAVAILTYVAESSVINSLVEAEPEDRKVIWERFWRDKDPTPQTPKNEFYEEHMRRFRYVNEHYAASGYEGWQTDRGRVYILYGKPDEIQSYPMEIDRDPMEVWYYFDGGKRFVFIDETGFGDYVLLRQD